jgi:glycosyltransferase involved in cell wall biosynthesis
MKILIASGIYPPDIGGPAQYARNLYETWKKQGHDVKVAAYRWERAFPPIVKHLFYFSKILRKGWNADLILVLDNFLSAVPTMLACMLMHKKYVIRTGGDLLWEWYVERTGEMILFKDFYSKPRTLSFKEKIIYKWSKAAFKHASAIIFSTQWQKDIWEKEYKLNPAKTYIVDNYCGPRESFIEPDNRTFVAGTRLIKWKNVELLKEAFEEARSEIKKRGLPDIELDCGKAVYDSFVEKIHRSYAVILVSLGDISPNMILDAVRVGTPFIVTKENGITDLIKNAALFVDPQNKKDIVEKIVWLADPANRATQAKKVQAISYIHSWEQIANEIVEIGSKK